MKKKKKDSLSKPCLLWLIALTNTAKLSRKTSSFEESCFPEIISKIFNLDKYFLIQVHSSKFGRRMDHHGHNTYWDYTILLLMFSHITTFITTYQMQLVIILKLVLNILVCFALFRWPSLVFVGCSRSCLDS